MKALLAIALACWANVAAAAPVTLICTGRLVAGGQTTELNGETAILDLQLSTFKPPLYNSFNVSRVSDSDISFASESETLSVWGSLDRVSGSLTMNVLEPQERRKLKAGGSAHFLAWMTAKCAPAQRMF